MYVAIVTRDRSFGPCTPWLIANKHMNAQTTRTALCIRSMTSAHAHMG